MRLYSSPRDAVPLQRRGIKGHAESPIQRPRGHPRCRSPVQRRAPDAASGQPRSGLAPEIPAMLLKQYVAFVFWGDQALFLRFFVGVLLKQMLSARGRQGLPHRSSIGRPSAACSSAPSARRRGPACTAWSTARSTARGRPLRPDRLARPLQGAGLLRRERPASTARSRRGSACSSRTAAASRASTSRSARAPRSTSCSSAATPTGPVIVGVAHNAQKPSAGHRREPHAQRHPDRRREPPGERGIGGPRNTLTMSSPVLGSSSTSASARTTSSRRPTATASWMQTGVSDIQSRVISPRT